MAGDRMVFDRYLGDCAVPTKIWVDGLDNMHILACCAEHERLVLEVIERKFPGVPRKVVE